jgi:cytochrome c oxidase accessory protein FixG
LAPSKKMVNVTGFSPKCQKVNSIRLERYLVSSISLYFSHCRGLKLKDSRYFFLIYWKENLCCSAWFFWPQDFFLFVLAMLTFAVFIVLFTVVFGRVFCGWMCPQTVFMEMIFRKVEYWIEGDSEKQKTLSNMPWNQEKILKRGGKALAFFAISFVIANYFLSYIIGMDNVVLYVKEGVIQHITTFIPLVLFSFVFFGVYWSFREQVCIIVCPYGRLQGVMLDPNSIVVAYDKVRGENRAKFKKNPEPNTGDCVDCFECVKVCPTGIDIRNGTQLECINCTACIDACDNIMTRFNRPTGLIKYASENNIAKGEKTKFTTRTAAYTAVLIVLLVVLTGLLISRKDIETNVMRAQGMLYQEQPNNKISNLYEVTLINKTRGDIPISFELEDKSLKGGVRMVGKSLLVKGESIGEAVMFIDIDKSALHQRHNKIKINVFSNGTQIDQVKTSFLAPSE